MSSFPRTEIGGVSMPRLICGTNWMLGYSHQTKAKDLLIKELFDTPAKMADVFEVFARAGCNAAMSMPSELISDALKETEQRTGVEMLWIVTPSYDRGGGPETWRPAVEKAKELGARFCFPHQTVTDPLLEKANRRLAPLLVEHLQFVREMEMIPGLSTHAPEAIICADSSEADVETYIQPYNAAGFFCQMETDWLQRIFSHARKPVTTIKPLASGRLHPVTGLTFVWNTIRPTDVVTIGTMSSYEAEEVVEISLACLEHREPDLDLQFTRSKRSVMPEEGMAQAAHD